MSIRGFLYRALMRIAHKYNWHYAPPIYPDGDIQLWCKWCGFRQTIFTRDKTREIIFPGGSQIPDNIRSPKDG